MDTRLHNLIRDYQAAVETAIGLLEAVGIPRPESAKAWVGYSVAPAGPLPDGGRYCVVGHGCNVSTPAVRVEFIFGDDGQIDGVEWSRLYSFARENLVSRYRIQDEPELVKLFFAACDAGELSYSGYILWYVTPTNIS